MENIKVFACNSAEEFTKEIYSETNMKFFPVTPILFVSEVVTEEKSKISLNYLF